MGFSVDILELVNIFRKVGGYVFVVVLVGKKLRDIWWIIRLSGFLYLSFLIDWFWFLVFCLGLIFVNFSLKVYLSK